MSSLSRQWRSLEQLANDPAFVARAAQEFPSLAEGLSAPQDRRRVLKLMAAGLALAGLGAASMGRRPACWCHRCGQSPTQCRPATICSPQPVCCRATRPVCWCGTTSAGRSRWKAIRCIRPVLARPMRLLRPSCWASTIPIARLAWSAKASRRTGRTCRPPWRRSARHGRRRMAKGCASSPAAITSPTLARQIKALQRRYPEMRWHQWEPVSRDAVRAGARLAYGQAVEIAPHVDAADVIVALDSDLLSSAPGHVRFAHDFATRRNPTRTAMSRIYAIEPTPSLIGVAADHRFIAAPDDIARMTAILSDAVLRSHASAGSAPPWLGSVVDDLKAHRGRAFVHVGPHLPPELHALAHAMNEALGGRGNTFDVIEPVEAVPDRSDGIAARVAAGHAGRPRAKPGHHRLPIRSTPHPAWFRGRAAPRAVLSNHHHRPK